MIFQKEDKPLSLLYLRGKQVGIYSLTLNSDPDFSMTATEIANYHPFAFFKGAVKNHNSCVVSAIFWFQGLLLSLFILKLYYTPDFLSCQQCVKHSKYRRETQGNKALF
jgi:hypothetical protein